MTDPVYERLREASWRRRLTAAEETQLREWLARHPEAADGWELEADLTEALGRLPDAPMPSNFTARVLQEVGREGRKRADSGAWWRWHGLLRWLPRVAVASVVVAAGVLSVQHTQNSKRQVRAESVRDMVSLTAYPGPEILQDFDAIQAMSQSPAADVELLKALQ